MLQGVNTEVFCAKFLSSLKKREEMNSISFRTQNRSKHNTPPQIFGKFPDRRTDVNFLSD